jgi:hypothetical protein
MMVKTLRSRLNTSCLKSSSQTSHSEVVTTPRRRPVTEVVCQTALRLWLSNIEVPHALHRLDTWLLNFFASVSGHPGQAQTIQSP